MDGRDGMGWDGMRREGRKEGKEGGKEGKKGKGREGRKEGRKEVSMYKKALISFGLHFAALAAICRGLDG